MTDDELRELFATIDELSIRKLFGGKGIYDGGTIIAVVLRNTLYLKGDDETAPLLEAEGCERWVYERDGRAPVAMPYWTAPDAIFDEPDEAARWVEIAREAAVRTSRKDRMKKARSRKTKTAKTEP